MLLASTSAIKQKENRVSLADGNRFSGRPIGALMQVGDDEKKAPEPEKVHLLEPEVYQHRSNDAANFPTPVPRTAFYAQQKLAQEDPMGSDEAPAEAEEKKPVRAQWTKKNHLKPFERVEMVDPIVNNGHTTFYDKRAGVWRSSDMQLAQKNALDGTTDIGRAGQIKGVHHFVTEEPSTQPLPLPRRDTAYDNNGSHPSAHPSSFAQKADIGRDGQIEGVQHFVHNEPSTQPLPGVRRETAYRSEEHTV